MNEKDIRSINGTRVADAILQLVPDVDTFRTAVRCIKLWAIRRGIYSNILGFLGGVAWAIMVARVCQLYPNACASTVASKVFGIMVNWQWPHPVRLCDDKEGPSLANLQSWDPKVKEKNEITCGRYLLSYRGISWIEHTRCPLSHLPIQQCAPHTT